MTNVSCCTFEGRSGNDSAYSGVDHIKCLCYLTDAIEKGHCMLILHCDPGKVKRCATCLGHAGAEPVIVVPVEH